MLPIVDKPLIQYAVEEALSAGARNLVFITGSSKRAIEDHFDSDRELESALEAQGKHELLDSLRGILPSRPVVCTSASRRRLGWGTPYYVRGPWSGTSRFSCTWPMTSSMQRFRACARWPISTSNITGACSASSKSRATRPSDYGIVASSAANGRVSRVDSIVEKPKPATAPSTLAVVGRYILTPRIFEKLETTGRGAGGEIQLTDGIAALLAEEPVFAYQFEGRRYDCGSKLGYLQATVEYALNHSSLGAEFEKYLLDLAATRRKRA